MFKLTKTRFLVPGPSEIEDLRAEFGENKCVVLPGFLDDSVLSFLLEHVANAEFQIRSDVGPTGEFARELTISSLSPIVHWFNLLLNNPDLFQTIQRLADCAPIGNFLGRIYRMLPDSDHYDSWHKDTGNFSLIGISINLSERKYLDGLFEIRHHGTPLPLARVANTGLGDALLFQIAEELEHRVTRVTGQFAKTAAVGQFFSEPTFLASLKGETEFETRTIRN